MLGKVGYAWEGGIWGELELHKVMKGGRSYCTEEKSNERAVCTASSHMSL